MDYGSLFASCAFGAVGMGMLMYGRRAGRLVPLGAGLALMVVPYFIPSMLIMLIVCSVLTVVPFVVREA
jgi:hypothetical protein